MERSSRFAGQGLTISAFVIGALFLGGGLIFMCAAVQNAGRFPLALVLMVLGGGVAIWAGTRLRKARQLSPDVVDGRIIDLATEYDAELTLSLIVGDLDLPREVARASLARLEANGLCLSESREGRTVYAFPGLKDSKVVRRCTYCGSEYSVREPLHKCSNCGGSLEIVKT
jgi:hypothetical protein